MSPARRSGTAGRRPTSDAPIDHRSRIAPARLAVERYHQQGGSDRRVRGRRAAEHGEATMIQAARKDGTVAGVLAYASRRTTAAVG